MDIHFQDQKITECKQLSWVWDKILNKTNLEEFMWSIMESAKLKWWRMKAEMNAVLTLEDVKRSLSSFISEELLILF
jgi:hypothetical protein